MLGRGVRRVSGHPGDMLEALIWAWRGSGLARQELARRVGVSANCVTHYLSGRRQHVGMDVCARWLQACGYALEVVRR